MLFTCATCHCEHDLDDISLGADAPAQWELLSDEERAGSELSSDQCIIHSAEGTRYFVRACLDIPIVGTSQHFTWGVWVSLSEASFAAMSEHWDNPARVGTGPFFGWLCTRVPDYPDSMFLKTMVHQREVGLRPFVELEPTDHPLAQDQTSGIEQARLHKLVSRLLHAP